MKRREIFLKKQNHEQNQINDYNTRSTVMYFKKNCVKFFFLQIKQIYWKDCIESVLHIWFTSDFHPHFSRSVAQLALSNFCTHRNALYVRHIFLGNSDIVSHVINYWFDAVRAALVIRDNQKATAAGAGPFFRIGFFCM